jgi:sialic acid synthase SpsE
MTEIVAEISGNHGGSLGNALALIVSAKEAGADAVKFQCFKPERIVERRKGNPYIAELLKGYNEPYLDLVKRVHTPWAWFPLLIETCKENGIAWFSSVFDPLDVKFLEQLDCPRYKISAFEMLDWDIIKAVRETGKPIVMSVRPTESVTVLHATNYDGSIAPLGISDHGMDKIPKGVPMIEWHLSLPGVATPDSDFSLTPKEMKMKISALRRSFGVEPRRSR